MVASSSRSVTVTTSTTVKKVTKKKKKKDDDDEDYEEGFFDTPPAKKARYADRKPGSFAMCAECNKKFTVTRYTNAHPDIDGGLLCGPCDKEIGPASGQVVGGKPQLGLPKATAKKPRAVKNKAVIAHDKPAVKSLTKCCIEILGKAIEAVEDLGEIGSVNQDRVCQIVCKNRELTAETVKLFLDVRKESLTLYDCTRLEPEALQMIANYCPDIETLRLYMCGFMDNETIIHYANRLKNLKHLQLFAAFLVRKEAWNEYFKILREDGRTLKGFMIQQSPRVDNSVLTSLVETCPDLTHLQLAECGALDDSSLDLLHPLKKLKYLDLSHGGLKGETFTDDGMIRLLEAVGSTLTTLILDDNALLTDRTLIEGIKVNCPNLVELSLKNLTELLPTGIAELFGEDWVNTKGMVRISLHRCIQLDDQALEAVVKHSGHSLVKLDLNSVDGVREKGLKYLAENAPELTELDVSFVREIDDFLLKHFLDKLPALKKIFIYGNNRISDLCPQKAGVRIHGHEQGVVNFE
ncbi:RNI-like protein [Cystobasidium minutum MCA 4210]|uniref:RNI-like protein n=1 Tax=Cystobasidium minutum MCA 4210 TaxID=1397322 RepID=UPI0034CE9BB2|eukprot:jgi/Rhomi1/147879/e_gw1.10.167.1